MVRRAENGADLLDREKSRRVGALAELWPFLRPYRLLLLSAMTALVLTAAVALLLPMAVRRVARPHFCTQTALPRMPSWHKRRDLWAVEGSGRLELASPTLQPNPSPSPNPNPNPNP